MISNAEVGDNDMQFMSSCVRHYVSLRPSILRGNCTTHVFRSGELR
jgi:hypothetical protein